MITLRDYQNDAVDNIREELRAGNKAMLVCPTGGGKTIIFCKMTETAHARGYRVMIMVHRQELLNQTSDTLAELGIPHACISPQHKQDDTALVQVAMVQTLARRRHKTTTPQLLIIDECHHSVSKTWSDTIAWADCMTVGVTATPLRLDGNGLGNVFGAMVVGTSTAELMQRGFLSTYKCYSVPYNSNGVLHTRMGDYVRAEVEEIANTVVGDVLGHWEKLAKGLPTIVFCSSIANADAVAEEFRVAGYNFKTINGNMKHEYRKGLIAALGNGDIDGLTSCDVVSEGTDIPVVSCAILLRKTKSVSLYLQQVGRVLRPQQGKVAVIIDHVGNALEHGLPDDPREWSLNDKVKLANDSVSECEECYAVYKKGLICPECGHIHVPVVKSVDSKPSNFIEATLQEVGRYSKPKGFAEDYKKFCLATDRKEGLAYYRSQAYTAVEALFGISPHLLKPRHWKEVQVYLKDDYLAPDTFAAMMKRDAEAFAEWCGDFEPLKKRFFNAK